MRRQRLTPERIARVIPRRDVPDGLHGNIPAARFAGWRGGIPAARFAQMAHGSIPAARFAGWRGDIPAARFAGWRAAVFPRRGLCG